MEKDDIERLFKRVAEHFKGATEPTKRMFSMLVDETLKFRDELLKGKNEILTVGETHRALDAFMKVLKTHEIPDGLEKNVKELLLRWLKALKLKISN